MNAALILTAIFNGAWQGAALCGLAVFAFRFFRRLNATTMFTVWSVLLATAVLLPFANYAFAPKPYVVVRTAVTQHKPVVAPRVHMQPLPIAAHVAIAPVTSAVSLSDIVESAAKAIFRYAPQLLLALAVIALLRLAILGRDVIRMLVARTRVREIDSPVALSGEIRRPFRFAASDEFTSPCVLGFAPALIVIPEALLAQAGTELTSVVLHEREHVRRFDDIQNVLQRFIGAIAFFCPAVRIALRELALYREQICDDAAVNAIGDRISYALTLTDLAQWAQGRGTPVPSLIFKRKHLLHRLEVLLDSAVNHSLHMNRRFACASVAALAIAAVLVLRIQVPVIAETIVNAPTPHAHVVRTYVHSQTHTSTQVRSSVRHVAQKLNVLAPKPVKHISQTTRMKLLPIALPRTSVVDEVAFAGSARRSDAGAVPVTVPVFAARHDNGSSDLLDALAAAGLRNLPVDQLIALRDHGVSSALVKAAISYFGRIGAGDLTYLSDHGVGPNYIQTLRSSGVTGITPTDAVTLMNHGVGSALIRAAVSYFATRPGTDDLVFMADHGIGAPFIDSLRAAGISVCWQDAVKMLDNGVDAAYVAKIRRVNPHATMSEIIRLRNAGF